MRQPQPDDAALIQLWQRGDHAAFEQLAHRYEGQVYNLAYRMTGNVSVAQDILQDTLTSAFRQAGRYRAGNFRAWILRIAANASKDFLRSADHRKQTSLEHLTETTLAQWPDPAESPEDYSLRLELANVLQQALLRLPLEQRLVLVLIDVQGLDYQAASELLKTPVGTVKSRLSRARAAMRVQLASQTELLPEQFRLNK